MRRHGLPLKERSNQGHTILPMEHHPPEFVICTGTNLSAASTALRQEQTLDWGVQAVELHQIYSNPIRDFISGGRPFSFC